MKRLVACILLSSTALGLPRNVNAQSIVPPSTLPPSYYTVDENGVDLATGAFVTSRVDLEMGPVSESGGVIYGEFASTRYGRRHSYAHDISVVDGKAYVTVGDSTEVLDRVSDGVYTSSLGQGTTLRLIQGNHRGSTYDYVDRNGMLTRLKRTDGVAFAQYSLAPNGEKTTYHWQEGQYIDAALDRLVYVWRLRGISTNRGYAIKFTYAADELSEYEDVIASWQLMIAATALNLTVDYCDMNADGLCGGVSARQATYVSESSDVLAVRKPDGAVTRYRFDGQGRLSGIRLPGSSVDDIVVAYVGLRVSSVRKASGTWTYGYAESGGFLTTTVTDPTQRVRTAKTDLAVGRPAEITVAGRKTTFTYDGQTRLTRRTAPEGDHLVLDYDARGNVLSSTYHGKTSASGSIASTAVYPPGCANVVTCNKPTSTTDGRGKTTSYTYDPTHGGVLTVTPPAGASTITYGYEAVTPAGEGTLKLLKSESRSTGGEMVTTTYSYTGTGNPLVGSVTTGGASASQTLSVNYTPAGDVTAVIGPMPGMRTRSYYDANRRLVGVIGPDPDGSGSRAFPVLKIDYDAQGRVITRSRGTAPGQDDNGAGFTALATRTYSYDPSIGRVRSALVAGGVERAVTDSRTDAAGRPLCSAVRMSTATFNLTSACTIGAADRVTMNKYDGDGLLSTVTTALGKPEAGTITYTYSANGQVASLKDGNNNLTSYAYDGFDRLRTTTYVGGSTEVLGYDAGGNVTSRTRRDGSEVTYSYDDVGRLKTRSIGGLNNGYAYDQLGRLTSATGGSYNVSRTYDALGRMLTDTTGTYTMTNQYDAAGRRTFTNWGGAASAAGWRSSSTTTSPRASSRTFAIPTTGRTRRSPTTTSAARRRSSAYRDPARSWPTGRTCAFRRSATISARGRATARVTTSFSLLRTTRPGRSRRVRRATTLTSTVRRRPTRPTPLTASTSWCPRRRRSAMTGGVIR